MSGRILTHDEIRDEITRIHVPAHPFSVSGIVAGDLHASRPYSFTVRIGNIVDVHRFADERDAVREHAQAVADVILLAEAAGEH